MKQGHRSASQFGAPFAAVFRSEHSLLKSLSKSMDDNFYSAKNQLALLLNDRFTCSRCSLFPLGTYIYS